jgi:hypothetical protein
MTVGPGRVVVLPQAEQRGRACGTRRRLTRTVPADGGGATGLVLCLWATRLQILAVAVVLALLYPAVPTALGLVALREKATRAQATGPVSSAAAVILLSLGWNAALGPPPAAPYGCPLGSAVVNRRRRKKLSRRLVDAVLIDDLTQVRALLRAGAPVETADSEGTTPLYQAAVNGNAAIVRVLLTAGASPDTESGTGSQGTPLCGAACWGHTEAVRALLEHGADPNLREDHGTGRPPLDWAAKGPHPETAELLVAAGARPTPASAPTGPGNG